MLTSFDHAVVAVRDLDRASDATARLLGRGPSWRGRHPGKGSSNVLFRLANGTLELLAPDGDGATGRLLTGLLETRGEGLVAVAFGCDDLAGFVANRSLRGLELTEPVAGEGVGAACGGSEPITRRWTSAWFPAAKSRGLPLFAIEYAGADGLSVQPPVGESAAAIDAFDHVVVLSDDPEASRDFYRDELELRLALDRDFEARGIRISFFRIGGVTLEVAGPRKPAAEPGDDRFGGICYRVSDVAAARERLAASGFDVSDPRTGHKPGTRVCTVRSDTCGVPTLLIQPAPR